MNKASNLAFLSAIVLPLALTACWRGSASGLADKTPTPSKQIVPDPAGGSPALPSVGNATQPTDGAVATPPSGNTAPPPAAETGTPPSTGSGAPTPGANGTPPAGSTANPGAPKTYSWSTALFGAGGYITGITYHPSVQGLVYIRTDVGGVYRRNPGSSTWVPLNDDLNRDDNQLEGAASLAIDPNDSQKLYVAAGMYLPSWGRNAAILRSSDRGATWSRTELPIRLGGNSDGRGTGERLQVDPNKGSILFLGTNENGLYKSTDGGVSWSQVPGFPTSAGATFVMFDKSSSSAGTATRTLYVGIAATSGETLYRSTDGGTTWAPVPGGPAGLMPVQGALDGTGRLVMTYANSLGPNNITAGAVYKLVTATTTWNNITPVAPSGSLPFGYSGLAVDAHNPNTIVVSTIDRWSTGDDLYKSTDGGATWTGLNAISTHAAPANPWVGAYSGGSLAGKMGHWISDIDIDPFNSNNIMYNTGYGLWESNTLGSATVAWLFNVNGIEETVFDAPLVSPSTGAHLFTALGDVAGARYDTNFNSISGYYSNPDSTHYSVDVAELNTNVVARTTATNALMLSSDNGITWRQAAAITGFDAGRVAVSAAGTALLWVPGGMPALYSTNGGASWAASTGYPVTGAVHSGRFFNPVADKVANGYFYTYDFSAGKILESANNGQSFAPIHSGLDVLPAWSSQHQLASVPGSVRRDLWLATPNGLWHINGAGAAPVKIANVQSAYGVGFGMAGVGKTYPAVYVSAKINDVFGVYQSLDAGATWTRINDDKHQWGGVNYVTGDMRVFGRVYVGAARGGVIVGDLQ
ncbi:sialidase family protein [Duganella sp. Root198D2]|uniref:WD40/YVTN/BNR-like repeat-containing protein n=1 Tax=Duganella sp. Root198D2 TaxID=1736489 RepID=UPI000A56514E|nr:sialidase family protein [Duganella sp. Root198D2]